MGEAIQTVPGAARGRGQTGVWRGQTGVVGDDLSGFQVSRVS